jgi:hypothetical protein
MKGRIAVALTPLGFVGVVGPVGFVGFVGFEGFEGPVDGRAEALN